MGCFLACFGFHKRRRKRRSPADGLITTGNQIHLSYEPLDSSRITTCDTNDKLEIQNSKPRERPKEQPRVKTRKKVRFNLDIQTYEPIPNDHYLLESDEEVKTEEATARTDSTSLLDKDITTSNSGNYPQNYRYQNCGDSYYEDDEEDEDDFAYDESDLDDSEIDEDHDELRSCELETNTVDRSQQVHFSVLKPVENLTQWRIAKAKAETITKKPRSNSTLPDTRMQENLVNSSLSNWL